MTVQHTPLKWPPNRPVDWVDFSERAAWVLEFREHLFDLFVVGLEFTKPPRKHAWTRSEARESLLANKQVLDQMLHLAGAPLELWEPISLPLPPPQFDDPPEIACGWPSPFRELPAAGWSTREQFKWLGYVEGQLDYLAGLLFMAYPEGNKEHRKARWAVIRLSVLFGKLRRALLLPPMQQ